MILYFISRFYGVETLHEVSRDGEARSIFRSSALLIFKTAKQECRVYVCQRAVLAAPLFFETVLSFPHLVLLFCISFCVWLPRRAILIVLLKLIVK